jgi:hypothetical protein
MVEAAVAKKLLFSVGLQGDFLAVALIHCVKEGFPGQFGIAVYNYRDIHYRFRTPESLLFLDDDIKEFTRENYIIRFDSRPILGQIFPSLPQIMLIVRQIPEKQHGFNLSGMDVQDSLTREDYLTSHSMKTLLARFSWEQKASAILFSSAMTGQRFIVVITDDNFTISLPSRLVTVAALLRCYSPSLHPQLRLLSHVPALASRANYTSLFIRFYSAEIVNSTRLFSGGQNRPSRDPNRRPSLPPPPLALHLKIESFQSQGRFLIAMSPWGGFFRKKYTLRTSLFFSASFDFAYRFSSIELTNNSALIFASYF